MQGILYNYKQWLTARQYSPQTIAAYFRRVEKFLIVYPPDKLKGITAKEIQSYLLNANTTSGKTINGLFSTLRNFFIYCRVAGITAPGLIDNPVKDLGPIKHPKTIPRIISLDNLQLMLRSPDLKTTRGVRNYAIMMLLLQGLRASEICNLNINDIYIDGRGVTRALTIRVNGKGRKQRALVVENSGDTEWALQRWTEYRGPAKIPELFPSYYHGKEKKLTREGLYHILQTYGRKTGVRGINPHAWRHTAAVKSLEEGIDIKEIQVRLGHESVATTEKYVAGASILQKGSANSQWIHKLRKADLRYRRRRRK